MTLSKARTWTTTGERKKNKKEEGESEKYDVMGDCHIESSRYEEGMQEREIERIHENALPRNLLRERRETKDRSTSSVKPSRTIEGKKSNQKYYVHSGLRASIRCMSPVHIRLIWDSVGPGEVRTEWAEKRRGKKEKEMLLGRIAD